MKRLFVFAPAFFIVVFLLNSFVLKEKVAGEITTAGTKSIKDPGTGDRALIDPSAKDSVFRANGNKPGLASSVLKSTDGGLTWQDISEGLPAIERPVNFFAGDSDLYLNVKNEMYRSKSNLISPVWEKMNVPDPQNASIAFNRSGIIAFNYKGQIYQKTSATQTWLPIHTNFSKHSMRTVFETPDGTVFLGYGHGLYKSIDRVKT